MKWNDMKVWIIAMILGALGFVLAAGPAGAASAVKFMDETGTAYGVKQAADNVPAMGDSTLTLSSGEMSGISHVNKYGLARDGVQVTATDIWDRADASATQQIWLAPTAARIHTIVSTDANDVSGIGTLTLTGQPLNTETVTIASKVYTFQTTLTDVDGNVKIGVDASGSIDNLIAGINLAAGGGSTYAASMTANAVATVAAAGAGDTMILWDHTSAAIATTETLTNGSWGAANTVNGTGATAIRVWYLPDWGTVETTADVVLHGDVGVAMSTAAAMINRMKVIPTGSVYNINAGAISATAATDATITSQITIGQGQTLQSPFGFASTQTGYLTSYHVDGHDSASPATPTEIDFTLLINERPDLDTTTFLNKSNVGAVTSGSSSFPRVYNPYMKIDGPALIKMQGIATTADSEGAAEFDLIIVND